MKKVLILTLEQGKNYGGMLQAYALQRTLKNMGYAVDSTYQLKQKAVTVSLKHLLKSILHIVRPSISNISSVDARIITSKTRQFVSEYIDMVPFSMLSHTYIQEHYDAIVVGSDQVWRAKYVDIPTYFLRFASEIELKRISYAASFGKDDIAEYAPGDLQTAKKYLNEFEAVSTRELGGVDIAQSLGFSGAVQHVDPTLLVEVDSYRQLIENSSNKLVNNKGLFAYVLDKSLENNSIISKIATATGTDFFEIMPASTRSKKDLYANKDKYEMPPVEQWIKSFEDASYVVTDSFHGTVFSIVFNRPFIAIGNSKRGLARFTSLLKIFGLEDRLVTSADAITDELISKEIDWNFVNATIKNQRSRSFAYLKKHLG